MHIVMNREEGKHQRPTHTWFPMFTPQYKDAKFQLFVQHQDYDRSKIVINKVLYLRLEFSRKCWVTGFFLYVIKVHLL